MKDKVVNNNEKKCIVRHIRDYSENKGEVYAFINVVEKKAYVGETGDGENRELTHAKCIFGLEEGGSNRNLIDEKQYNGYCLLYLYSFPDKSKDDKEWIAMETIYMYLFVKHGYQLYNSENGRDNVGKKRKFLIENTDQDELKKQDELKNYLMKFLEEYPVPTELYDGNTDEKWSISSWDGLLEFAEKIFIEDLTGTFNWDIFEDIDSDMREKLWEAFVSDKSSDENFLVLENMKDTQDFFVFNIEKLKKLSNEYGYEIGKISIKELLDNDKSDNNKRDCIIYSKVGDYLGETVYQILSNKFYDLQCKYDPFEKQCKDKGVCFWSVDGNQQEWIRDMLSSECNKEDVYMLLFYTGSKNLSGELPEKKKAKTFSLNRKDKCKYEYPDMYKDELIGARKNMAFLIADFYYPKEKISTDMIETTYKGMYESADSSYICDGHSQKTYYLAEIEDNDKNKLLEKLKDVEEPTNQTRMIVARLTYPYVVAID